MLIVNMLSSADKIAAQGVGSAYLELIEMLRRDAADKLAIKVNDSKKSDITHYHTVDFKYYLSTFLKSWTGARVGYVHFLPETLDGSIKLPSFMLKVFKSYLMSFYRRMDQLVVVSPEYVKKLVALGIREENIKYIPNFVAKNQWFEFPTVKKLTLRKKFGINPEKFVVLGVGQVQRRKGIDDFAKLAELNSDIQFIWAGGFSFGKISDGYDRYNSLIENSPKNLKFTGIIARDELLKYYNCANLFLLPSFSELFPMSILESCSCGTPIMLRDLELYRGILEGKYIAANDLEEMNDKLQKFVADPAELSYYRERTFDVAREYSENSLCKIWLDFYYKQVKNKKLPV